MPCRCPEKGFALPARKFTFRSMFEAKLQTFTDSADGSAGPARVAALRARFAALGIDGFLVPRADEHQGEYVPPSDERLAWLTGFTGSAGYAVVLASRAALLVDGRYTVQALEQADAATFEQVALHEVSPARWLVTAAPKGARIGYDAALHTPGEIARIEATVARAGISLVAVDNPIDLIWQDRPAPPKGKVVGHPATLAGETGAAKIARVRESLTREGVDALLVSDPHALAWLFNIRGSDVQYTPLPLGYALVPRDSMPTLFLHPEKLTPALGTTLGTLATLAAPATLEPALRAFAKGRRIRLDAATAGMRLKRWIEEAGGSADIGTDPIALMKAAKNAAEQAGTRAAHQRDGAAMVNFLAWFDAEAPKGKLTEIDAVAALETFRRATGKLKNLSFPSISGANAHAALPHYRVTARTNAPIRKGIFLIDSGGQYLDGTTDITRTLAVGTPTRAMKECNTRVLKGMIAISRTVFPKGTSGAQLDVLARHALWQAGLDYDHGTGHGVGSYLSVHEGPQRISKLGHTPLEPGMILSNEPGYYRPGAFGIRIENLVMVEKRAIPGAEREMYGFETLTFAPIDTRLIEKKLLDAGEIAWLNAYHKAVWNHLAPLVDPANKPWLKSATAPL